MTVLKGLHGTRLANTTPQVDCCLSPDGHGVIVIDLHDDFGIQVDSKIDNKIEMEGFVATASLSFVVVSLLPPGAGQVGHCWISKSSLGKVLESMPKVEHFKPQRPPRPRLNHWPPILGCLAPPSEYFGRHAKHQGAGPVGHCWIIKRSLGKVLESMPMVEHFKPQRPSCPRLNHWPPILRVSCSSIRTFWKTCQASRWKTSCRRSTTFFFPKATASLSSMLVLLLHQSGDRPVGNRMVTRLNPAAW